MRAERVQPVAAAEPASRAVRRRWRASRFWVWLAAAVVLGALAVTALAGARDSRPLGPANPGPEGAQAVVRVLERQGVRVVVAGRLDDAMAAAAAGSATLLLHDPGAILEAGQLQRLAGTGARTVLVEPGFAQLRAFTDAVRPAGVAPDGAPERVAAACPAPVASEAPAAAPGGHIYRADTGCYAYRTADGTAYGYAVEGRTAVLGNAAVLANGSVLDAGHPALALWTLGAEPTLVWYQPTAADLVPSAVPASPLELLPDWFGPAAGWALLTGLVAVLWRARRDGPLVVEPLPVVVPAAETAEGRARLYRASGDTAAAAAALRSASLSRAAAHLRLGPGASASSVVAALARASSRPAPEVARLFDASGIRSEAALVAWANDLHTLEKEIGIP